MQVEELFELAQWVEREIDGKRVIGLYNSLLQVLSQNAQPNTAKVSFEECQITLVNTLLRVPLTTLSFGQIELLTKLDIAENVGKEGVDSLEDILFRNALDIATAVTKVTQKIELLQTGVTWFHSLKTLLSKIIDEDVVREIDNTVLMRVHFQNDAHLDNLKDFKDWGKAWYEIGRGISMANGSSPEEIEVVGASKGSIIITLMAGYAIAKTVSEIILQGLKVTEKVYEIKKKSQEIRALKLSNDKAEKLLEEEATLVKTQGLETIVAETIKQLGLKAESDGDKITALESSVKKLVGFIEQGGEVDFVVPEEDEVPTEEPLDPNTKVREELRMIFREVRAIEKKILEIEHRSD